MNMATGQYNGKEALSGENILQELLPNLNGAQDDRRTSLSGNEDKRLAQAAANLTIGQFLNPLPLSGGGSSRYNSPSYVLTKAADLEEKLIHMHHGQDRMVGEQQMAHSPMAGGNLHPDKIKSVFAPDEHGKLSPPSSTSTLSSVNLLQRLNEISDSLKPMIKAAILPSGTQDHRHFLGLDDLDNDLAASISRLHDSTMVHDEEGPEHAKKAKIDWSHFYKAGCTDVIQTNFVPTDVMVSGRQIFVSSQMSNQVAIFNAERRGGQMPLAEKWPDPSLRYDSSGALSMCGNRTFQLPRNLLTIPRPSCKSDAVMVLDDVGFHVFEENGMYLTSLFPGQGRKFRGLGLFRCRDQFRVVTLDVTSCEQHQVSLCHFAVEFDAIRPRETPMTRIQVPETRGEVNPMCRFVTVFNDCHSEWISAGHQHLAFLAGMSSKRLYKVDLCTGKSCLFSTKVFSPALDVTFAPSACSSYSFIQPCGLAVDGLGNVLVGDRKKHCIVAFDPDGLFLGQVIPPDVLGEPCGFSFCSKSNRLIVADIDRNLVHIFSMT